MKEILVIAVLAAVALGGAMILVPNAPQSVASIAPMVATDQSSSDPTQVLHKTINIDGINIFYRQAGPVNAPTLVLLHGFPTSSHMYRNLIPALADRYRVIAPDYPGFGQSDMPSVNDFEYTFDRLSEVVEALIDQLNIDTFSLYLQDYGAPVGFRIASRNPERVESLIIQNGNAYNEGLLEFWDPFRAYWAEPNEANADVLRGFLKLDATIWQFTHGVRNPDTVSPDNWIVTQFGLDRPGNQAIQLALFLDYGANLERYPAWQHYLRTYQPPTLIAWGKNDVIFPAEGAYPYQRDLNNLEFHLLDTGHFALEEDGELIAQLIRNFLAKNLR